MHRIESPGATQDNRWTEGDPASGTLATEISAAWMNAVQDEIVKVVEAGGQALKTADTETGNQLLIALQAMGVGTGQFQNYSGLRTYSTGEVVRGSDGKFYEFYDRDQVGTVKGVDPTVSTNRPHVWMEWHGVRPGTVIEWRASTLPEGYLENDGAIVSRSHYRRIFAANGTTHGAGDGSTTFGMPDDRGEFKRGWDHGRGVDTGRLLSKWQKGSPIAGDDSGQNQIVGLLGDISISAMRPEYFDNPVGLESLSVGYSVAESLRTGGSNQAFLGSSRPRNNAVIYLTKI